jgi:hypothetical protein
MVGSFSAVVGTIARYVRRSGAWRRPGGLGKADNEAEQRQSMDPDCAQEVPECWRHTHIKAFHPSS